MPVYIAQTPSGLMKVGYSWSPVVRVAGLRRNGERAELLWFARFSSKEEELHFERFLLGEFENTSIGGEWFANGDSAILDRIDVCRQKMDAARSGKHSLRLLKIPSVQVLHELACFDALIERTSRAA